MDENHWPVLSMRVGKLSYSFHLEGFYTGATSPEDGRSRGGRGEREGGGEGEGEGEEEEEGCRRRAGRGNGESLVNGINNNNGNIQQGAQVGDTVQ